MLMCAILGLDNARIVGPVEMRDKRRKALEARDALKGPRRVVPGQNFKIFGCQGSQI
jgi:hypothetical protein